ncbi:MAG: anthranilate synthase component I [Gammaproteobacteria bacterium]|nr:anthranilate synthase component I [Gammaproteobacteria bacterium]
MSQDEFQDYAKQGYNRIPLVKSVLADMDTPLSAYLKLANGAYSYLFESVQGGEKWGRYSIIGLPCARRIEVRGHQVSEIEKDTVLKQKTVDDPLEYIENYQAQFRVPEIEGLPRFTGGLVGYFGYDTVRYIEPRLGECPNKDTLNQPDIVLLLSEEVVVFDNLRGKLYIIANVDPSQDQAYENGKKRLNEISSGLLKPFSPPLADARAEKLLEGDFVPEFPQEEFKAAVSKARNYIIEGDIMQVVLAQRMYADYDGDPLDLYRALRTMNPSPYMYYVDLDGFHIVGSSPEILVRLEDDIVTVRPIAGTRPRGETEAEDLALEQDLLADPKELAEHLMLIDLGRNDVGRIAQIGTVELTTKMVIERYSHVMHIVSNVIGKRRPEVSAIDVLRATFPAGTVSGAAKVRAMEIIDELEPVKRGIYSGAVGYISWNGNIDTAIAIRTAVVQDNRVYVQAGAGVVYDSVPESEWQETINKGRALVRAAMEAASGLRDSDSEHR